MPALAVVLSFLPCAASCLPLLATAVAFLPCFAAGTCTADADVAAATGVGALLGSAPSASARDRRLPSPLAGVVADAAADLPSLSSAMMVAACEDVGDDEAAADVADAADVFAAASCAAALDDEAGAAAVAAVAEAADTAAAAGFSASADADVADASVSSC